jgi:hypothetical protein
MKTMIIITCVLVSGAILIKGTNYLASQQLNPACVEMYNSVKGVSREAAWGGPVEKLCTEEAVAEAQKRLLESLRR